jgi:hypothetical protein
MNCLKKGIFRSFGAATSLCGFRFYKYFVPPGLKIGD